MVSTRSYQDTPGYTIYQSTSPSYIHQNTPGYLHSNTTEWIHQNTPGCVSHHMQRSSQRPALSAELLHLNTILCKQGPSVFWLSCTFGSVIPSCHILSPLLPLLLFPIPPKLCTATGEDEGNGKGANLLEFTSRISNSVKKIGKGSDHPHNTFQNFERIWSPPLPQ